MTNASRQVSTRRRGPAIASLFVYVGLAVLLFSRAWASPRTSWVGDPGDPAKFMWFLRWNPYALAHGLNPFFTHHIDSLHGVNLLWDTSVALPSIVLAPITLLLGPIVAFNVAATAAIALSGWCAYLCYRRYVTSHLAAATGGLLYGFSPYAIAHAHGGHLNLSFVFTAPLLFLLLDEILVRQQQRVVVVGLLLGALAGAQLLISQEILVTEALMALAGVIALVILRPRDVASHLPYVARALGIALGLFVVLAAAPIMAALFSSRRPHHGTLWGQDIFVSDLYGFVVPTSLQQLRFAGSSHVTDHFTDSCCIADSHTYIGVPLIALLAYSSVRNWAKLVVRVVTLVALTALLFSLGPHLHVQGHVTSIGLPQSWFGSLPLLGNMMASRLMMYFYLCAGLLVAVLLDGVWRREPDDPEQLPFAGMPKEPPRWSALWAIGGTVVALAFIFPHVPFPATHATVPAFFSSDDVQRIPLGSVALIAPFARDTNTSEPMLWQAVADMRFRTPEGYATGPDDNGNFTFLPVPTRLSTLMQDIQDGKASPPMTKALRAHLLAELRREHVQTVIVGPFSQEDTMARFFTRLFRRRPERLGGVRAWFDVGPP